MPYPFEWTFPNRQDLVEVIHSLAPKKVPWASRDYALIQKRKAGGSMRKRRRAMMKPLRFTPKPKAALIHEWPIIKATIDAAIKSCRD